MDTSPFKYGITVSKNSFTDREKEAQKIYNNLTQEVTRSDFC